MSSTWLKTDSELCKQDQLNNLFEHHHTTKEGRFENSEHTWCQSCYNQYEKSLFNESQSDKQRKNKSAKKEALIEINSLCFCYLNQKNNKLVRPSIEYVKYKLIDPKKNG